MGLKDTIANGEIIFVPDPKRIPNIEKLAPSFLTSIQILLIKTGPNVLRIEDEKLSSTHQHLDKGVTCVTPSVTFPCYSSDRLPFS